MSIAANFTKTLLLVGSLVPGAGAAPLLQHSDVFISGKEGYSSFRIPGIETAPDGSVIAFAEARKYSAADPGFGRQEIHLVYRRSTNQGATWSPMTVLEAPGEFWSAANPATVVDRSNGRLWVFYLRSRPGRSTETSRPGTDDMQTLARWSDDHGQTWSGPLDLTAVGRDMSDPAWRASVPGPGGAIQTRQGRLLVPMWKNPSAVFAIFSDDHGRTWQRGQFVPGKRGGDENQAVELVDGRILMDIRQNSGAHRWLAESTNGGNTWAEPRSGLTVTPVMCAIERFTLQAAGDDRNRLVWTGPKGPDRRRLVIRTSDDEGKTFAHERLISDNYAAYSDLTILKDKTVGVLWERGVEHGYQFITFTRLNRDWLEAESPPEAPLLKTPYKVISRGEAAGSYQAFTDITRLKNRDLLCVFYAGYGHVSLPRPDCPKGGRICCVRSPDEGRTWSAPRLLFDGPFDDRDPHIAQMHDGAVVCSFFTCQIDATPGAYASTVELKDGTVLVVYYEEGTGSAVRARRFKLKAEGIEFLELDAR